MAVLSDADRNEVTEELMRELSDGRVPCPVLKAALRAAVDATDTYQNSNAAAYNSALPNPFRTNADASLKSRLFRMVSRKRYEKGS